jgi:hypothetical protein
LKAQDWKMVHFLWFGHGTPIAPHLRCGPKRFTVHGSILHDNHPGMAANCGKMPGFFLNTVEREH